MNSIDKYIKIEEEFFNNVQIEFEESLLFYCVAGSLSRKDIIPGWSDIDIIMVFKKYDGSMFCKLNNLIGDIKQKHAIKIGVTFYSLQEFNSMYFQDPKTYFSIYLMNIGRMVPRIKNEKIIIGEVKNDFLKSVSLTEITRQLHIIKRELINYSRENEKKIYKSMVTVLKLILILKNKISFGYVDTFEKIRELYDNDFKKSLLPKDIINKSDEFEKRLQYYIGFLNWLDDKNNTLLS